MAEWYRAATTAGEGAVAALFPPPTPLPPLSASSGDVDVELEDKDEELFVWAVLLLMEPLVNEWPTVFCMM